MRNASESHQESQQVQKTGIEGLDKVLTGGIPNSHIVMLSGKPGTGKTILSTQWLFAGYREYGERGLYLAVTEPVTDTIANVQRMSFYQNGDGVRFTDLRTTFNLLEIDDGCIDRDDIERLIDAICQLVEDTEAERLVIDSITAIGYLIDNRKLFRYFIFRLGNAISEHSCTAVLTSEAFHEQSPFHVEHFIADGIIRLCYEEGEQSMVRNLNISKMRGVEYRSGIVNFTISYDGVTVFPKIPIERTVAETKLSDQKGSGNAELDEMLGGGYPQGHMVLLGGNSGTGKTTFGIQYLINGLEQGEPGVFVNLEEPQDQIEKIAQARGHDIGQYAEDGLLHYISPSLIDTYGDKLLYDIIDTVEETGAERVLIDSVSSLRSEIMDEQKLRELLLQLTSAFKTRGTTCLMTYLTSEMFTGDANQVLGGAEASSVRISSICDGILLLRYVETENEVEKALNILKMRGADHSTAIRRFDIVDGDIVIGETFDSH